MRGSGSREPAPQGQGRARQSSLEQAWGRPQQGQEVLPGAGPGQPPGGGSGAPARGIGARPRRAASFSNVGEGQPDLHRFWGGDTTRARTGAAPRETRGGGRLRRSASSPVRSAGVPLRRVGEVTFGDDRRAKVVKPRPRKTEREMDPGVARLLFDLRTQLASHGARGISGLSRKFRICDDDGDGKLSHSEFNKAINELGLAELTAQERRVLFDHFDRDGNGTLTYEEFLSNVRGPLSQPRIEVIDQAFDILDLDKDGSILPDEIAQRFDASQHPDVLQGKCTQQDVYRDFLDTFDVGGVKDHRVTRQEFRNYYHNVSCSIDSDAYFIQMIRNAWHMGAKSTTAATTAAVVVVAAAAAER